MKVSQSIINQSIRKISFSISQALTQSIICPEFSQQVSVSVFMRVSEIKKQQVCKKSKLVKVNK